MNRASQILVLLSLIGFASCDPGEDPAVERDYKEEMRRFVIEISTYAKSIDSDFLIVPQNGIELVTKDGSAEGDLHLAYLEAVDGHGQEDLFFGYENDDEASPASATLYLKNYLSRSANAGNRILVTDYCSTKTNVDRSYISNAECGFIAFAAGRRALDEIPTYPQTVVQKNASHILSLNDAQNFLYLLNSEHFDSKSAFIQTLSSTAYDAIIMDLYFADGQPFTPDDLEKLRNKPQGGRRLLLAYMSIGEAEDYRDYWQNEWTQHPPTWLEKENPDWKGNFKVRYWDANWKAIIYGSQTSYTHKLLEAGFDGAYLDIIDAFEYFE